MLGTNLVFDNLLGRKHHYFGWL